jgi:sugar lactone lactonase YvrE
VLNEYSALASGGSITIYPAASSGDAVPIDTITSSFNGIFFATAIAVDPAGNIYVADEAPAIYIYAAGSYATGPPVATIVGNDTGLGLPIGIAVDSKGDSYALDNSGYITVYPAGSSGDATPKATINIDNHGNSSASAIAVGPRGDLYVANDGVTKCHQGACYQTNSDSVAVYPAGSDGNAKPIALIAGPKTKLASPSAITVGRSGNIYVANQGPVKCTNSCGCYPVGPGSITVYPPGSAGNVKPVATISGEDSGIGQPYGIALDRDGRIYVLNNLRSVEVCALNEVGIKSVPGPMLVFAAGSNGDVAPTATIGGPFTGLVDSTGIAVGPAGP